MTTSPPAAPPAPTARPVVAPPLERRRSKLRLTLPRSSTRHPPLRLTSLLELGLGLLAVAVSFGTFAGFYAPVRWVLPVVAALLFGTGLALLACWREWPGWLLGLVAVPVLVVFEVYALYRTTLWFGIPGFESVRAVLDGVISGWARMLTVAVPADPDGDLMAVPTLLASVAGIATTVLMLRTRVVVGLAVIPILVFVAGLLVTATRPRFGLAVTCVLLLVLLALLLVRTNRLSAADDGLAEASADAVGLDLGAQRRHSVTGRVLVGLPAVALIAAAAVLGGLFLPIADGQERADPRALIMPDLQVVAGLSPLVEVRPQLSDPTPQTLFEVTVPAEQQNPITHVRIAALDSFDGALWSQTREYEQAGSTLPESAVSLAGAHDVVLGVRVMHYRNAFLPVVGVPIATSGVDAAVEPESGTLVSIAALEGTPLPDLRYEVTAAVVPPEGLGSGTISPDFPEFAVLPNVPDWVEPKAREITADANTPYEALTKLQDFLYGRAYNLTARPGESYGAIERVLGPDEADQVGYAEQYASAFAVLARSLGYRTRIAVGYILDDKSRAGDTYAVTTANAHAWPEVLFDKYGWVPFEPTNQGNVVVRPPPPPIDPKDLTAPEDQPQDVQPEAGAEQGGTTTSVTLQDRLLTGLWVALAVIAAIVLLIGTIVLFKQLRRARRRVRGSPALRIAAAWQEVQDRLREAGHPAAVSQTPIELAEAIGRSKPGPNARSLVAALTELAVIVTYAVCAPDAPTPVAARHAWQLHDQVVKALAAERPPLARALALIDPRPLLPGANRLHKESTGSSGGRHSRTEPTGTHAGSGH